MSRKLLVGMLATLLTIPLVGCSQAGAPPAALPTKQVGTMTADQQQAIVDEFTQLAQKEGVHAAELIRYISKHGHEFSKENATIVMLRIEEIQQKERTYFEEQFARPEVQQKLTDIAGPNINAIDINSLQDAQIRDMLKETKESGFKIETAEGMYFPVIDYEAYKKYSAFVTPDIAEYIEIMAIESAQVPVKDAGLMISWEEIMKRIVRQEQFLTQYPQSKRTAEIKQVYNQYVSHVFYGTNNSPLFDYETMKMDEKAKIAYANTQYPDSQVMRTIREFMDILKANDYLLTNEIQAQRKQLAERVKQAQSQQNMDGRWSTDGGWFILTLVQEGTDITGSHFAMTNNAGRIDTIQEGPYQGRSIVGTVEGNIAHVQWRSGRDGTEGTATLELVDGQQVKWTMTGVGPAKNGAYDYLMPKEATLTRAN